MSSKASENNEPLPSWFSEEFFDDIFVQKYQLERGKFTMKINTIEPTGGTGENYTSRLYRANADAECDGNTVKVDLIVKEMLHDLAFKELHIFDIEKCAYEKLLPTLEALWKNVGKDLVQFAPRCWKTVEAETDVIVLDDLQAQGYKVTDRWEGLDLSHTKLLLAKLAKFHAASATDFRMNGSFDPLFEGGLFDEKGRNYRDQYYRFVTPIFLDSLNSWVDGENIKKKLARIMDDCTERLYQASKMDESGFVTLCHGDLWTNNQLYRYDDLGNPEDTLLIDFQLLSYGSPAQDLFYFLTTSPQLDLKTNYFDELIHFYHSQLADALRKLSYPPGEIPSLRDLQQDLHKRSYLAVQSLSWILPIALAEKSDHADHDGLMGEQESDVQFRHAMFSNPLFQTHLRAQLEMFDARGWLQHY